MQIDKNIFTRYFTQIQNAETVLHYFKSKYCRKILLYLLLYPDSVPSAIYKAIKWDQSNTSERLNQMKKIGILTTRQNGKFIHYSLNADLVKVVADMCETITQTLKPKA